MSQPRSRMADCLPDLMIDVAAGVKTVGEYIGSEKRINKRHDYAALVGLIFLRRDGSTGRPVAARSKNLSATGICVTTREPVEIGQRGAVQLIRSNGTTAVVGVRVQHCHCFGELAGCEMGLQFVPVPRGLSTADFLDEQQKLKYMDPILASQPPAPARKRSA